MKTFTKMAAQGDFIIFRVDTIPDNVEPMLPCQGQHGVAHSETGHDHVMLADHVAAYRPAGVRDEELYRMFFTVAAPSEIRHLRSHDTHETLLVPPGNYEVRRQREYVAQGFRRAQD